MQKQNKIAVSTKIGSTWRTRKEIRIFFVEWKEMFNFWSTFEGVELPLRDYISIIAAGEMWFWEGDQMFIFQLQQASVEENHVQENNLQSSLCDNNKEKGRQEKGQQKRGGGGWCPTVFEEFISVLYHPVYCI